MSYIISNGPFKGVVAPTEELRSTERQGSFVDVWDVHSRTRQFLDVFPPSEGWRVEIQVLDTGLKMVDYYTLDSHGQPVVQPTREFRAQLLNAEGNIVSSGSVLRMVNAEGAWKGGVTSARGALYEALGLPDSLTHANDDEDRRATPAARAVAMPPAVEVVGHSPLPEVSSYDPADIRPLEITDAPDERSAQESPIDATAESSLDIASVVIELPLALPAESADTTLVDDAATQATANEDAAATLPAPAAAKQPATHVPTGSHRAMQDLAAKHPNGIPPSLLKQIQIKSTKAGKAVPEFSNLDEAQVFLASLVVRPQAQQGGAV